MRSDFKDSNDDADAVVVADPDEEMTVLARDEAAFWA